MCKDVRDIASEIKFSFSSKTYMNKYTNLFKGIPHKLLVIV